MILRLYSLLVVTLDVLCLLIQGAFCYVAALYRLFVSPPEKSIEGEIVLVTGAGQGIGRELCIQLAKFGAIVVCWDISKESNDETVRLVQRNNGRAYGFKCDVSARSEVQKTAALVRQDVGDVTIVINNAGIMPCRSFLSHGHKEIERVFDVNVISHIWVNQEFLPRMIGMNHGHIVALSSVVGLMGIPNLVPYSATKYAVRGMMEALAEEIRTDIRDLDIHFTTIYPFVIDTGLAKLPKARFPNAFPVIDKQVAAQKIIQAMRRNYAEQSIPESFLGLYIFRRMIPRRLLHMMNDFFGVGLDPHEG